MLVFVISQLLWSYIYACCQGRKGEWQSESVTWPNQNIVLGHTWWKGQVACPCTSSTTDLSQYIHWPLARLWISWGTKTNFYLLARNMLSNPWHPMTLLRSRAIGDFFYKRPAFLCPFHRLYFVILFGWLVGCLFLSWSPVLAGVCLRNKKLGVDRQLIIAVPEAQGRAVNVQGHTPISRQSIWAFWRLPHDKQQTSTNLNKYRT